MGIIGSDPKSEVGSQNDQTSPVLWDRLLRGLRNALAATVEVEEEAGVAQDLELLADLVPDNPFLANLFASGFARSETGARLR
jgi:hypothetical protein